MEKPNQHQEFKKPVILFFDAGNENVQAIHILLKKLDCTIAAARTERQAMNFAENQSPDLILFDMTDSIPEGVATGKKLKSLPRLKDIPMILITDLIHNESIIGNFEPGTVDFIKRPFTVREILTKIRFHLALKNSREKLGGEIQSNNKFISIISHELRGALGIIHGFSEILQKNKNNMTESEVDTILDDLVHITDTTLVLLENLLQWSKYHSGGMKFRPVKLNLQQLLSEAFDAYERLAASKNILMSSSVNTKDLAADRNMLLLVFRNLLSNAIKFTPVGGRITVSSMYKNGMVLISVADTGVGISSGKLEQLFDVENRISTPGTMNEQGNGMGLLLCREFVRQHGGEIGIDSMPGTGTTIWFTLPVTVKIPSGVEL